MERVILNKIESIERCVKRIDEIYSNNKKLLDDYLLQDALILNIQRACQQSIDLAMYICSKQALGIPKRSADAFIMLKNAGIITANSSSIMGKMVGFRNIAIHEYQDIEMQVVEYIAQEGKNDFIVFTGEILQFLKKLNL